MSEQIGANDRALETRMDRELESDEVREISEQYLLSLEQAHLLKVWWDMHDEREEMKLLHEERIQTAREEIAQEENAKRLSLPISDVPRDSLHAIFEKKASLRFKRNNYLGWLLVGILSFLVYSHYYEAAVIFSFSSLFMLLLSIEHDLWVILNDRNK